MDQIVGLGALVLTIAINLIGFGSNFVRHGAKLDAVSKEIDELKTAIEKNKSDTEIRFVGVHTKFDTRGEETRSYQERAAEKFATRAELRSTETRFLEEVREISKKLDRNFEQLFKHLLDSMPRQ